MSYSYIKNEKVDETILKSFKIENNELEMVTKGGAGHQMMINLVNFYEANGGKNYFTTTMECTVRGERRRYEITICNLDGNKSPAETIRELKNEIKQLKSQ
jgi:hypothetical protein